MISPRECVERALYELGRESTSYGGWKHKLSALVFGSMTEQQRF